MHQGAPYRSPKMGLGLGDGDGLGLGDGDGLGLGLGDRLSDAGGEPPARLPAEKWSIAHPAPPSQASIPAEPAGRGEVSV
jgi:hypothetical protein